MGVMAIAIAEVITNSIGFIMNSIPNKKYIKYGFGEQFVDVLPSFIISIVMFVIVFIENFIPVNYIFLLIIQILSGIMVYFGLAYLSHHKVLVLILEMFRNRRKKE